MGTGAVCARDTTLHHTLTKAVQGGKAQSISSAIGHLCDLLLTAVKAEAENESASPLSESVLMRNVIRGELALVLIVHSADTIVSVLGVKSDVEEAIVAAADIRGSSKVRLVLLGVAEAHILAA